MRNGRTATGRTEGAGDTFSAVPGEESATRQQPVERGQGFDHERGSATAELAVIMPVVILLTALVVGAGASGATAVKAEEAARMAARSVARGESWDRAQHVAQGIVGEKAHVDFRRDGQDVDVRVSVPAPGVLGSWGDLVLSAHARTRAEANEP